MRIYYNVYQYMVSAMLSHRDTVTVCEDNTFIRYTQKPMFLGNNN